MLLTKDIIKIEEISKNLVQKNILGIKNFSVRKIKSITKTRRALVQSYQIKSLQQIWTLNCIVMLAYILRQRFFQTDGDFYGLKLVFLLEVFD